MATGVTARVLCRRGKTLVRTLRFPMPCCIPVATSVRTVYSLGAPFPNSHPKSNLQPFHFPVSAPDLSLTIIGRKAAFHTAQLAMPPVVRAFGLLEHFDSITLPEDKVSFALSSEVIQRSHEDEL